MEMGERMYPNLRDYRALAATYDVIPVWREVLADFDTPVSVLSRLADRPNVFLLESVEGGEHWGRYSFVGVDPEPLLEVDHSGGRSGQLEALRHVYSGLRVAPVAGVPRFFGGAVGYLAYEAAGEFERLPAPKPSPSEEAPVSRFLRADRLIVFDNVRHTMKAVVCTRPGEAGTPDSAYEKAKTDLNAMVRLLEAAPSRSVLGRHCPAPEFRPNMTAEEFESKVERTREYIRAGDIIQAVMSQRWTAQSQVPPLSIYRALRLLNPSPYLFFLKIGSEILIGSSPEVMVRLTGNRIELRPIAGTRPRGRSEQEDRRLADELLSNEKEKAEHVMLVDLGRNDVGRVAEAGSVQVTEYMVIERYSHVMHLVSHVEGVLRQDRDAYDVLWATFPAGTLTGAPKIRAMEIIQELEPEPRGPYGGAVGYVAYNGALDFAITIRTLVVKGDRLWVQAGAGIVHDSDPRLEYEETCHKARALQRAVDMAASGLGLPEE